MTNSIASPTEALHSIVLGQRTTPGFITAQRASEDLAVSVTTARRLLNAVVERGWATTSTMISRAHSRRGTKIRYYEITQRGTEAYESNEAW